MTDFTRSFGWCGLLFLAIGCGQSASDDPLGEEALRLTAPVQVNAFALLASGRAVFQDRSAVTGGHIGVAPGSGDSITAGFDARIALGRATLGQRVVLKDRAAVGDLFATTVVGPLGAFTSLSAYSTPPAAPPIRPFSAGSTPVTVNSPLTLAAGTYGNVTVDSTLTLSGGTYQIQNLTLATNAVLQATAASILRVAGRVTGGNNNRLQPTGSQPAGSLRLIVAGATDTNGGVLLGNDAVVSALIVSQASFRVGDRFRGSGAVAARNLTLGFDARYAFATGFECNSDASCNDSNACTDDACVDAKCVHSNVADGTLCPDDGSVCTTDVCSSGACTHPPLPDGTACTSDDNTCTNDTCASGVCDHPAVPDGTACPDDLDACTTDACSLGVCEHPGISGCAVLGPDGGTVGTADGAAVLTVPAGALGADTQINIVPAPIEATAPYSGLIPGTLFDFEPHGLVFGAPATLTLRYDPAQVPAGIDPSTLVVLSSEHGMSGPITPLSRWEERPSSVDTTTGFVSAEVEHFSHDGVGVPVTRIEIDPPNVAIIPGTRQAVNVALFSADDKRLEHVIDWTSDDTNIVDAVVTVGLDQALVTSDAFGSLGETTVTASVRNGAEPGASTSIPAKVALSTLAFQNAVSSESNAGANDGRTIGYSYSHDLGIPAFWGSLNPFVEPMTATFSALTYRGQELAVIDGPFYGYDDDDQGGDNSFGQFSTTHGWSFITDLKFSSMHLEPGDETSMTYNHDTGHVMRYVRGTCSQRIPWVDVFQQLSDATESGLICETADVAFGMLGVDRRYFMAQPHFTSEVGLSSLNSAPVDAGFFLEAQYDARVPVIGAGVTIGFNPGYSVKRRSDGFVSVALINDAPNVQVVNDQDMGGQTVSKTMRDKLRTQLPQMFEKSINDQLVQTIPPPLAATCDPTAANASQLCFDGLMTSLAAFCALGVAPETCIANQVLTPANFLCPSSGSCSFHPSVVEVNVLPEELELVFAPNPFLPAAQIDRFFRVLSDTTGVELCGPDVPTATRIGMPVAGVQLGAKSIGDTPTVPCD